MQPSFDQTSALSIEAYGQRLIGRTLRTQPGTIPLPAEILDTTTGSKSRGSFGTLLERYYYGINPGNESAPDFTEAGVELKSTPLKRLLKGEFAAKERLVLNVINYEKEALVPDFKSSSFLKKNAIIMLVSYEHKKSRAIVDHPVRVAKLFSYSELPEADQRIIENDWMLIASKIKSGRAHELHEGETIYLSACTKAANSSITRTQAVGGPPAKPRAYSFKAGYMTATLRRMLGPTVENDDNEEAISAFDLQNKTFEEEIISRFKPYIGKSLGEISNLINSEGLNSRAKSYYATLTRRMIGIKGNRIEEFEKAEIAMKTVQLKSDGTPKEDMSFPRFRFQDLLEQDWDAADIGDSKAVSSFKKQLQQRFLMVVYQCKKDCKGKDSRFLKKVFFWTMPSEDIEVGARQVWERAVAAVLESNSLAFPKASESPVAHVRPKALNKLDVDLFPDGSSSTKRSFWLNKEYIKSLIIESQQT